MTPQKDWNLKALQFIRLGSSCCVGMIRKLLQNETKHVHILGLAELQLKKLQLYFSTFYFDLKTQMNSITVYFYEQR